MKKLLFILSVFFVTMAVNAQPAPVQIKIGGKYGNFKDIENDTKTKPLHGERTETGTVISVGELHCISNKCTVNYITIKTMNSINLIIGTKDHGFDLPAGIVGKKISVEGIAADKRDGVLTTEGADYQKDIQFSATGIKVIR